VERSIADTRTPNVVTSIIMDYRGFDTLIETCVIFTAGIACAAVLRKS
jgi:multicomponent Na+:H+ antiporter subunit B